MFLIRLALPRRMEQGLIGDIRFLRAAKVIGTCFETRTAVRKSVSHYTVIRVPSSSTVQRRIGDLGNRDGNKSERLSATRRRDVGNIPKRRQASHRITTTLHFELYKGKSQKKRISGHFLQNRRKKRSRIDSKPCLSPPEGKHTGHFCLFSERPARAR